MPEQYLGRAGWEAAHDPTRWASRVLSCWVATPPGGHSCPMSHRTLPDQPLHPWSAHRAPLPTSVGELLHTLPGPSSTPAASTKPPLFSRLLSHRPLLHPNPCSEAEHPLPRATPRLSEPSSRSPPSQRPGSPQDPKSLDKDLRNEYVTHILSYRCRESHRSSLWARETVLGPAGSRVHVGSVMLPVFSARWSAGSLNLVWLLAVPTRRPLLGAGSLSLLPPRGSLGLEGGVHAQPWGPGGQSRTSCPVAPSQELSWS